jgi:hypothetical protein
MAAPAPGILRSLTHLPAHCMLYEPPIILLVDPWSLRGSAGCALPTVWVRVPCRMRDGGTLEAFGRPHLPCGCTLCWYQSLPRREETVLETVLGCGQSDRGAAPGWSRCTSPAPGWSRCTSPTQGLVPKILAGREPRSRLSCRT